MADYKEKLISGKSWQRATRVFIENPLGGVPSITFEEEEVTQAGDKVHTKGCGSVGTQFDTQNPDHVAIYTALNTLYMLLASNRDVIAKEVSEKEVR